MKNADILYKDITIVEQPGSSFLGFFKSETTDAETLFNGFQDIFKKKGHGFK